MEHCFKPLYFKMKFFKNIFRAWAFFFFKLAHNVKVLCVCGGLVALPVDIALKLNRITAVDFSTSTAITQNTCYALVAVFQQ